MDGLGRNGRDGTIRSGPGILSHLGIGILGIRSPTTTTGARLGMTIRGRVGSRSPQKPPSPRRQATFYPC